MTRTGMLVGMFLSLGLTACQSAEDPEIVVAPTEHHAEAREPTSEPMDPNPTHEPEPIFPRAEIVLPVAEPDPVSAWRPPPYPVPLAIRPTDHYYLTRPIPSGDVNWPNPRYRYGSTAFGEASIHTGVDLGADRDTPVVAAGVGEVIWVGYGLYGGVYDPLDPYGLAVAIRHDFGHLGQPVYTVYGHLQSVDVWPGQRLRVGDRIGTVGDTGHASGPHLHFEVRIGENRYFASLNPELWMVPAEGWGVLAGRIQGTYGQDLSEYLVLVKSVETQQIWEVWSYALGTVQSDQYYQENFVIGDLPAGPYELRIDFAGRSHTTFLYLNPGQTNFVEFRGRNGFTVERQGSPALSQSPPYP